MFRYALRPPPNAPLIQSVDRYLAFCTMPRKPYSAIVDCLSRNLSSLVGEATEIREGVPPHQGDKVTQSRGPSLLWKQ
jgi:hypothetical protein